MATQPSAGLAQVSLWATRADSNQFSCTGRGQSVQVITTQQLWYRLWRLRWLRLWRWLWRWLLRELWRRLWWRRRLCLGRFHHSTSHLGAPWDSERVPALRWCRSGGPNRAWRCSSQRSGFTAWRRRRLHCGWAHRPRCLAGSGCGRTPGNLSHRQARVILFGAARRAQVFLRQRALRGARILPVIQSSVRSNGRRSSGRSSGRSRGSSSGRGDRYSGRDRRGGGGGGRWRLARLPYTGTNAEELLFVR